MLISMPDMVTNVTLINQVNIGSDHRVATSNIKPDVEVGRKTIMTNQIELRNRFETLQEELDDIDTMSETTIDIIQQIG